MPPQVESEWVAILRRTFNSYKSTHAQRVEFNTMAVVHAEIIHFNLKVLYENVRMYYVSNILKILTGNCWIIGEHVEM